MKMIKIIFILHEQNKRKNFHSQVYKRTTFCLTKLIKHEKHFP